MAEELVFSHGPITITGTGSGGYISAGQKQSLWDATDVSSYDILDLQLQVQGWQGYFGGAFQLALITSMQNQIDDSTWYQVALFPQINSGTNPPVCAPLSLTGGFLKYLRWSVYANGGGTVTSITLLITGMGRRY